MSSRSIKASPLLRNASFMKDKLLEKKEKLMERSILRKSTSFKKETNLLNKEEVQQLMEHVKYLLVYLRARVELSMQEAEAKKEAAPAVHVFESNPDTANPLKTLSDARVIQAVASAGHHNLLETLNNFQISTIANVVHLIFRSAEAPLIKPEILAEILSLEDAATRSKTTIAVDDIRAALGKLSARNVDLLGQLIGLMATDSVGSTRLSYCWGPLLFVPRFDSSKASVTKEYESFDLMRQTRVVVNVTKQMIDLCDEIFALDDHNHVLSIVRQIQEVTRKKLAAAAVVPTKVTPAKIAKESSNQSLKRVSLEDDKKDVGLGQCKVIFAFEAQYNPEISVDVGEILDILEVGQDDWWLVRTSDNQEGLVPESYVERIKATATNRRTIIGRHTSSSEDAGEIVTAPVEADFETKTSEVDLYSHYEAEIERLRNRVSELETLLATRSVDESNKKKKASKAFSEKAPPPLPYRPAADESKEEDEQPEEDFQEEMIAPPVHSPPRRNPTNKMVQQQRQTRSPPQQTRSPPSKPASTQVRTPMPHGNNANNGSELQKKLSARAAKFRNNDE